MIIRIINIRRHKQFTFLDAYVPDNGILQFMIDSKQSERYKVGDIITVNAEKIRNNRGNEIIYISNVLDYVPTLSHETYKGKKYENSDPKYFDYINSRNGGNQIELLYYKKNIIDFIKQKLNHNNFFDATTLINNVEKYKNGSNITDAVISNREFPSPMYMRVTLENQLKQMVSILLKSVYSIDKVYRNMGEDSGHINEFLMFEFVSLNYSIDDIIQFVLSLDKEARSLINNYNLNINTLPKDIEIIKYEDLIKKGFLEFSQIQKELSNTLILDFPCESPFIKETNGKKTEIRWYMNGKWISHFYDDENDYEKIKRSLEKQNNATNKENTNNLDYMSFGIPNTTSFGLSIDRWLQLFLDKQNINSIANPLQLDYVKRMERK